VLNLIHKLYLYVYAPLLFVLVNVARLATVHGTSEKSYFQADYAIPLLLAAILKRLHVSRPKSIFLILTSVSFFVVNDALFVFARRFRWDLYTLPQYILSFRELPWVVIWPISIALMFCILLLSATMLFSYGKTYSIGSLLFVVVGLQIADMRVGTSHFRDSTSGIDIITSSSLVTIPVYIGYLEGGASLSRYDGESLFGYVASNPGNTSVLSVSVESLGLARSASDMVALTFAIPHRLGGKYEIEQHHHKFFGSTLQGEIRELCGERLIGNASEKAIIRRLHRCLPKMLQANGYATDALHGNGGRFYNRRTIYPAMGFQRSWFYDDIVAADRSAGPCPRTAFNAVCDDRLYARALSLFDGKNRFVHIMTLDSHLPVPDADGLTCPQAFSDDRPLCAYANLISRSLDELGSAITAAPHKPDLIFIYGDHAPPFSKSTTRARFADDEVPFFVLKRKR
jgi:hypothetical protein